MTPEHKAMELIRDFWPICGGSRFTKACAIKTTKECLISSVYTVVHYSKIDNKDLWCHFKSYWEEVLVEIDKTMIIN